MTEQATPDSNPRDLDHEQAKLAFTIITALLDHTRIISDLLALMAQVLDEDTTKALTSTPQWQAYLDSRRSMERTRSEVERFRDEMTRFGDDASP